MWRTAPLSDPIARARSIDQVTGLGRPRWRRLAIAVGLTVALAGAGAGTGAAVAAPESQAVIAWGANGGGPTAVPPEAQSNVIAIDTGLVTPTHALALKSDGSVIGWGANGFGQATVPAAASSGVTAVSVGGTHSLALKSDGSVLAWGQNRAGEAVVPPEAASDVVAIAAGIGLSFVLKSDGSVFGWGQSFQNELPVPPAAQSGVSAISVGSNHVLALKNGGVIAWGSNSFGQTGVPVGAQSDVVAISAGEFHSLALKADGSVVGWGDSFFGGRAANPPADAASGVVSISAGSGFSLAVKSNGSLVGWGAPGGPFGIPNGGGIVRDANVVAAAAGGNYSLTLEDLATAPTISGTPPSGAVGEPYSFAYTVTGVPAPSTSVFSGTQLPPGLSLSAEGVLSGTPTQAGTFSFIVVAFNGVTPDAAVESTITVNQAPTISGTPPGGTVGQAYSFSYSLTGSPAPSASLLAGTSLPPGLSLSAAGALSGTPTTAGTFNFTVVASNGVNPNALLESSITVAAAAKPKADVSVAITGPATAKKGAPVSYQVTVSNAGPQESVNVRATLAVSSNMTIQTIPSGATRAGQIVTFPTANYTAGQQRQFTITLVPKANSGTALLGAAAASLVTSDPKLVNNAAAKEVRLTK